MPKRGDIASILVLGAGPIVIGQACEFDYSGAQACKALKEEGYRVILVNSNPATIMTDADLADATYVEPLTPEMIERIIEKERPDAVLPTPASKATGFPIAKVAAKPAVGYRLDELKNDITRATPASFEPTIDYVVTKVPRFTFEKFPEAEAALSTSMKSVGEVMAIGRSFKESLQKALRSLETGLTGLDEIEIPGAHLAGRLGGPGAGLRIPAPALPGQPPSHRPGAAPRRVPGLRPAGLATGSLVPAPDRRDRGDGGGGARERLARRPRGAR